jgi:hypothetical protein
MDTTTQLAGYSLSASVFMSHTRIGMIAGKVVEAVSEVVRSGVMR